MTKPLLPPEHPWADRILIFDSLPSSNTFAKELAAQGAAHGTAVVARAQTGGRGRMGRSFSSPEGQGVYLSLILRPNCKADALMHLTCAVAVAMVEAVEQVAGVAPDIKWINDLILHGKKLGGILTELSMGADGSVESAVVGIGINCLQEAFPGELETIATSLLMETGKHISPDTLAAAMLGSLHKMWDGIFSHKADIMAEYARRCITLGKEIRLIRGEEIRFGTALGLTESGSLTVRFPDGHTEDVDSGEVSVRNL